MNNSYRPRGFSFFPPVIKNLLIINGIIYFIMVISINIRISDGGGTLYNLIMEYFALLPIDSGFRPWQLISYQFMHQTFYFNVDGSYTLAFSHILFNMFALWMFGASIEDVFGSKRFLIFYLLAGISAGLLQLFISPLLGAPLGATVGASGSIYGVMVAYAMFFPDNLIFLYFLIPVKAKYLIGFLIVFEFLMIDSASSGVAHLAHLGGALFAFLYIMFDKNSYVSLKNLFNKSFYYKSKPKRDIFTNPFSRSSQIDNDVQDANYYDINKKDDYEVSQEEIDKILDKISQSGYQNLTDHEKKILFQASKKMK